MKKNSVWTILKETFRAWNEDKVTRLASSTAYYTLFSLAPLLVIAIAIAGFFFSRQTVQAQLTSQIAALAGDRVAAAIQGMISSSYKNNSNVVATIVGVVLLLVGASGVFGSLQDALNTIWGVKPDPKRGVRSTIFNRIFSFAMVLVIGFLLLVTVVASTVLASIGALFTNLLPGASEGLLVQGTNLVLSFAVIMLLIALIYKVLPDVNVNWRNVWIGAAFTAVLFTIGREVIGLYLEMSSVSSVYGAAGSLVVILLWVYYSAMILYFGAEFTQVYTHAYGGEIRPKQGAVWMTEQDPANPGTGRTQPSPQPAAPPPPRSAVGLMPVMAVAGAGEGEREIRMPSTPSDPPSTDPGLGLPPMPQPVRTLTILLGALAAVVSVVSLLTARTRPCNIDQRLLEQRKEMQAEARSLMEEAGRVRSQALQMQTTTGRLDEIGSRLREESARLRSAASQKIR
jgi:membrane protein